MIEIIVSVWVNNTFRGLAIVEKIYNVGILKGEAVLMWAFNSIQAKGKF